MSGTTAFDAKTNLVALAKAAPAFSDVTVWYGREETTDATPRLILWFGEIEWETEDYPNSSSAREEVYSIVATVESHVPGDTQSGANARVETLGQALEILVRVSPTNKNPLNIAGIWSTEIVPQFLGEGVDPEGRGAIWVLLVRIKARK